MAELIWTERAVASLENIHDYIAEDSPVYARRQITNILKGAERLTLFPESGRHIPEFPHMPHREIIVSSIRVIYSYDSEEKRLFIVNVIHGHRVLNEDMLSDR
jgi:toxin ParE1/3/4